MKSLSLVSLSALILVLASCKKDDKCNAGIGGNVTVVAFPKHHGVSVRPHYVCVQFNTQDFPGVDSSLYDLVVIADTTEDHIEIENLKCGDYYIYEVGFDTAIAQVVSGGIPYSFDQTSSEIDLEVPVTE